VSDSGSSVVSGGGSGSSGSSGGSRKCSGGGGSGITNDNDGTNGTLSDRNATSHQQSQCGRGSATAQTSGLANYYHKSEESC
jgi:hypothetical protein